MGVKISMSVPNVAESVPLVRHVLDEAVRHAGLSADRRLDLELAVGEACGNVVRHAGVATFDVVISLEEEAVRVEVSDRGRGGAPAILPVVGPLAESGRGLALMRALSDDCRVESRPGSGTRVCLLQRLRGDRWDGLAPGPGSSDPDGSRDPSSVRPGLAAGTG